jgi:hypothetical protein
MIYRMNQDKLNAIIEMDKFCHDYTVKLTQQEAIDFISVAPVYNRMCRELMIELVTELNQYVQVLQYKWIDAFYTVGNESSRVIYLHITKPMTKGITSTKIGIELEKLGKHANADECSCHSKGSFEYVYRFWWD